MSGPVKSWGSGSSEHPPRMQVWRLASRTRGRGLDGGAGTPACPAVESALVPKAVGVGGQTSNLGDALAAPGRVDKGGGQN